MDNKTLSSVYGVVGTVLFGFAFNLFWYERTGGILTKAIVPHAQLPSAILIAEFPITIVGLFLLYVVQKYWHANRDKSWVERLPAAFIDPSLPRDGLATVIRIIGFISFILVPAYIAVHFLDYLGDHPVVDRRGEFDDLSFWSPTMAFFEPGTFADDNRFRFENRDGVTFIPFLETVAIALLVSANVGLAIFHCGRVVRKAVWRG